jgi:hypothetical protein
MIPTATSPSKTRLWGPRSPWPTTSWSPANELPAVASWKRRRSRAALSSLASDSHTGDDHLAGEVGEHLTALGVDAEQPRGTVEADRFQVPQEGMDVVRPLMQRPAHGLADPDDALGLRPPARACPVSSSTS